ncbi:hypothetical protein L0U85_15830, partial [Glycomyces sp. L485]|nr:hypothetical protein [Glycomyces sp. L485]
MEYEAVKEDLRRAYDANAEARARMEDTPWKRAERARFAAHLREDGLSSLLEIGAGHGVSGRYRFSGEGFVLCLGRRWIRVDCLLDSPAERDCPNRWVFGIVVPLVYLRSVLLRYRYRVYPTAPQRVSLA